MMNKSQIKFEVLEGHKFGVVEGHIQNIECLVGNKCISNLEIKIIGGSSMTIMMISFGIIMSIHTHRRLWSS